MYWHPTTASRVSNMHLCHPNGHLKNKIKERNKKKTKKLSINFDHNVHIGVMIYRYRTLTFIQYELIPLYLVNKKFFHSKFYLLET